MSDDNIKAEHQRAIRLIDLCNKLAGILRELDISDETAPYVILLPEKHAYYLEVIATRMNGRSAHQRPGGYTLDPIRSPDGRLIRRFRLGSFEWHYFSTDESDPTEN